MTNVKNQHVVPRQENWAAEPEGGQKASRLFENKQDAVLYASEIAKKHNGCVIVHNGEGKFQRFQCRDDISLSETSSMNTEKKEIYPVDPVLSNMSMNDDIYLEDNFERSNYFTGSYHVVNSGGKWLVVTERNDRNPELFSNKGSALIYAYEMARKKDACVYVHKVDKEFREMVCPPERLGVVERTRMALRV